MNITPEKIAEWRETMRDDLLAYGYFVCNNLTYHKSQCVLHQDIAKFHHDRPRYCAIVSPRGHAKTTWASTIGTSHDIAYDSEDVIFLIKKTFAQATTDLQNITSIIKYNERWKALYGEREFIMDRQEKVYILNPETGHRTYLETKGANMSLRGTVVDGHRITKMLLDDFEDENNTGTVEQREKVRNWISAQLMPAMDPAKGRIMAIGTIIHYDSWLNNLWENYKLAQKEHRKYSWKVIFHQVKKNGVPIWPEQFPEEYIKELEDSYAELGNINQFYQEYYNIPFNIDDASFQKNMVKYYKGDLRYDAEQHIHILTINQKEIVVDCILAYDPSSGLSKDYTGKVILLTDKEGNRYLYHADRHMFKPNELIKDIFETDKRYHPRKIVIEEESMAVIFGFWIQSEMRNTNQFLRIKGEKVPRNVSKNDKLIDGLEPYYANGVMHHQHGMTAAEEELFTFPKGRNDDILDAIWLALKNSRKPTNGFVEITTDKYRSEMDAQIDWMTGASWKEYNNGGVPVENSVYNRML